MTKDAFEQDNDTWQPLSLATRRLLEACEQKKEDRERDAQRDRDDEEKAEKHRKAVERGLRDIAAFEQRFRPGYRSRRKRN